MVCTSSGPELVWGCLGDCFDLRARFRLLLVDPGLDCQALPLTLLPLLLAAVLLLLLAALLLLLARLAALPLALLLAPLFTSRLALLEAEAAATEPARAPASAPLELLLGMAAWENRQLSLVHFLRAWSRHASALRTVTRPCPLASARSPFLASLACGRGLGACWVGLLRM